MPRRVAALARFYTEVLGVQHGEVSSPRDWEAWTKVPVLLSRHQDDDVVDFELGVGSEGVVDGVGIGVSIQGVLGW